MATAPSWPEQGAHDRLTADADEIATTCGGTAMLSSTNGGIGGSSISSMTSLRRQPIDEGGHFREAFEFSFFLNKESSVVVGPCNR